MKSTLLMLVLFLIGMSFAGNGGPNRGTGTTAGNRSDIEEPQGAAESEGTDVTEGTDVIEGTDVADTTVQANNGRNRHRYRWGGEFLNGIPAELREKVEALREEADKKWKIIREVTPEEAEVIKSQWRRGSRQKKDAAVDALPEKNQGKVRGILEKIDDKNTEIDKDVRLRFHYRERIRDCEIPEDCLEKIPAKIPEKKEMPSLDIGG